MSAAAASRKINRKPPPKAAVPSNNNNGGRNSKSSSSGSRSRGSYQSSNPPKHRNSQTTSVPSQVSQQPDINVSNVYESTDLLLPSVSRMSEVGKIKQNSEKQNNRNSLIGSSVSSDNVKDKNIVAGMSPTSAKNGTMYLSNQKKLLQSTNLSRTTSSLNSKAGSTATTFGANSRVGGIKPNIGAVAERRYYMKAIAIMVGGGILFTTGIVFAGLYFAGYAIYQIVGPICLAMGLLLFVCGIVWIPIIKTKLKRQQQIMSRTFSL